MEEILARKPGRQECRLVKNSIGLYDLRITDERGAVLVDVQNVHFKCAAGIIEENMYADNREWMIPAEVGK